MSPPGDDLSRTIAWTESESNIGIAIDAACDYEVAMSRLRFLREQGRSDYRKLAKAAKRVAIPASTIAGAFAGIGLETWLNRLAATVLPTKVKVNNWDKNSAREKYKELMDKIGCEPPSEKLQDRIDQLMNLRNHIVHDKSMIIFESGEKRNFRSKEATDMEPLECIRTLVTAEEEFIENAPRFKDVAKMNTLAARDSRSWLNSARLRIGATLSFSGGEVPDAHQYRMFHRRRLEAQCPAVWVDPESGCLERVE